MRRTMTVVFLVTMVSLLATAPVMAAPAPATATLPDTSAAAAPGWHCVRHGETLFSIGRRYGVNPWAIASANHLYNPNKIYAGQCLYIPPRTCYGWNCGCWNYRCGYQWCCWR